MQKVKMMKNVLSVFMIVKLQFLKGKMKTYGITSQKESVDKVELHYENLRIKGFSVEPSVLTSTISDTFSKTLEEIYFLVDYEQRSVFCLLKYLSNVYTTNANT